MILAIVVAMTMLPVVDVGLGLVRNYARASVGEAVTRRLRTDLFNHLIHARLDDIERTRLGHIVTVLTRSCAAWARCSSLRPSCSPSITRCWSS